MDIHTPIDNYQHSPRTTSQSSPSSPSSPSDFSIFSFSHFSPDTRFEPPISVAHQEIPRQAQDTVEENPTASRTTTTDTHTAAISSTPTPTHISHIGSNDILTVLLGGSLPGTNTAGNTEACPGQQWLTVWTNTSNSEITTQIAGSRIRFRVWRMYILGSVGGVLNSEADLDQRWLDGIVEHESMGTRHDNRALAARLADSLQVAYRQYQSTLWKYHRDHLVEVG
ncbi:hypothetical protein BASA81_010501 [Batrachochytrium salamandrivorans]|nr:hypothetical protein BASA81_010501 [Batrachochytrium salamandrivorans]